MNGHTNGGLCLRWEYYTAMKKEGATDTCYNWMNLENMMLSEKPDAKSYTL